MLWPFVYGRTQNTRPAPTDRISSCAERHRRCVRGVSFAGPLSTRCTVVSDAIRIAVSKCNALEGWLASHSSKRKRSPPSHKATADAPAFALAPLRAKAGAGEGNRTLMASLEGWNFTI